MGSKGILDSLRLLDETLVSLTKACKSFPTGEIARPTIERYIRRGSGNPRIVLESVLICGKRWTSKEAIDRFIRNQLHVEADRQEPKKTMSKRELTEASRKFNLPEPQGRQD